MMSVLMMAGDHPRHRFLVECVARSGLLRGIVIERRETFIPTPAAGLPEATRRLFLRHFAERAAAEDRFFGSSPAEVPNIQRLEISKDELNGPRVWEFFDRIRPDLLLTYGVHRLTDETLSHAPGLRWNIHGGLSPWYRGVATLFWPSYLLEPQMTGMTVHELTQALDGGDTIHQVAAELVPGDGIHELACRAVTRLGCELAALVERAHQSPPVASPQRTTGRIWRVHDWRAEHLHVIYDLYDNRIVDRYLANEFEKREPSLVRAL